MPRLSLVVSTVGRPPELRRLLDSIRRSSRGDVEVVVVDQDPDLRALTVLTSGNWPFVWQHTSSGRGLSRGRNVGLGLARGSIIAFPDDDCWYPPSLVDSVISFFDRRNDVDGLCCRQVTSAGRSSMLRFPRSARPVTRANILNTAISSGIFLKRSVVERVGAFEEDLGAGSGWRGSGEETDYVLRALATGARVLFEPALVVLQEDPRDGEPCASTEKSLRYGCGIGTILRRWRFAPSYIGYLLLRRAMKVVLLVASRRWSEARHASAWGRGVMHGLLGIEPRRQ